MILYSNGQIKYENRLDKTTLIINLSLESGQDLMKNLPVILQDYKRYVECIEFTGEITDPYEMCKILQQIHGANLRTCVKCASPDKLSAAMLSELDYAEAEDKVFQKEYSPFADEYIWM